MPEIKTEIIDTNVKLDKQDEETIVSQIVKDFTTWDDDRQGQIDIIDKLEDLLDVETTEVESEYEFTNEEGKTYKKPLNKIKDADILQLFNSAVAHTYNSTFKTPAQMIDVQLEDELNDSIMMQKAYLQKAALLDVFKKSRAKAECRKAIENWYKKGEIILYVNWKQEFQNIRRKNPVAKIVNLLGKPFNIQMKEWQIQRVLKYDGVKVKCIDPKKFVFDTTRPDEEGRPWIFQDFETFHNIRDNEEYIKHLNEEALEELENLVKNEKKTLNNVESDDENSNGSGVKDGQIELLTFNGDISIKGDGESKFYRNMRIIVIGRKYIGCFKYNPDIVDPIIYCAARIHRDTGRGIPALSFVIPMTEASQEILNKINKAIGLTLNKCYLAPKGSLEGQMECKEGGVIEYNNNFDISRVIAMDFHSGIPGMIQFNEYLESKKEQAFGRYKYSTGDMPSNKRTATEVRATVSGQDVIVSYENDILANDVVIPMFEKMGEFMANFQDQPIQMKYKDRTGAEQVGIIDDTVRQGNYVYMIGDTSTTLEKKANVEQFLLGLKQVAELAMAQGKRLNLQEIINTFGAIYDIENPMKFLEEMPMPIMGGIVNEPPEGTGMPPGVGNVPDPGMGGNPPALPPGNI